MIVSWIFGSDGAFGGPDGDLLGRAEIDPGEAQVEKAFAQYRIDDPTAVSDVKQEGGDA